MSRLRWFFIDLEFVGIITDESASSRPRWPLSGENNSPPNLRPGTCNSQPRIDRPWDKGSPARAQSGARPCLEVEKSFCEESRAGSRDMNRLGPYRVNSLWFSIPILARIKAPGPLLTTIKDESCAAEHGKLTIRE
jgi:hypothetical protein